MPDWAVVGFVDTFLRWSMARYYVSRSLHEGRRKSGQLSYRIAAQKLEAAVSAAVCSLLAEEGRLAEHLQDCNARELRKALGYGAALLSSAKKIPGIRVLESP